MPQAAAGINADLQVAMRELHNVMPSKGATAAGRRGKLAGWARSSFQCAACTAKLPLPHRHKRSIGAMAVPDSLQNAVKTLTAALDLLEAAVERRTKADAARGDLEAELAVMQDDRTLLGEALERSRAEAARLAAASDAVAARLTRMGEICAAALARPEA
jgi:hypothetical protein